METIRSEEEEDEFAEPEGIPFSMRANDRSEPDCVVVNPFWAEGDERHHFLSNQLTVKPDCAEVLQVPDTSRKTNRRPLVKQKKYCQSSDDIALVVANVENNSAPITINVTSTLSNDTGTPYGGDEDADQDSNNHLKPTQFIPNRNASSSSCRAGLRSRQQSVESRVTSVQGPIEDGAPLPAAFLPVPIHLYGKPLQEIDPTVRDKVRNLQFSITIPLTIPQMKAALNEFFMIDHD